jgi:hypothetical protein
MTARTTRPPPLSQLRLLTTTKRPTNKLHPPSWRHQPTLSDCVDLAISKVVGKLQSNYFMVAAETQLRNESVESTQIFLTWGVVRTASVV